MTSYKRLPAPEPTGGRPRRVAYSPYNPRPGAAKRLTYDAALLKAKRLLGAAAAIKFIRTPKAKRAGPHTHDEWYKVGVIFESEVDGVTRKLFGEVGSGTSWRKALADAATRVRKLAKARRAEQAKGDA